MKKNSIILYILPLLLIISSKAFAMKGEIAPENFMPDPGFVNWTEQNPLFNSEVPYDPTPSQFGSYQIVDRTSDKNDLYLNCDYNEKIFVADGLPFPSDDPATRFLLLEFQIDVNPNREYHLSFNYMNPDIQWPDNVPSLSTEIDGIEIMSPTLVVNPSRRCDPNNFSYSFNSGSRTTITLSIYNNSIFTYPAGEDISPESIIGNDIALWAFELYQECEMTDNDIQDFVLCEGETINSIEKVLSDVDGTAEVTWNFEVGGTFTQNSITNYTPTESERVTVEILSSIGCTEYDTFNINLFKFPTDMEISATVGQGMLCPCETTALEIPDNLPIGNFEYKWTTTNPEYQISNDTETIIYVDRPGDYILTITEESLGCQRTLSYRIEGQTGFARIYAENIQGTIGDQATLTIGSNVSQGFIDCGFEEINATLLYDYTVLHNPDIPYTVEAEGLAAYPISIPINSTIDIPFKILLGLSETSNLELYDPKLKCSDYDGFFEVENGTMLTQGICKESGSRLVEPLSAFELKNSYTINNKLHVDFLIQETTTHFIRVYDLTGRLIGYKEFEGNSGKLENLELDLNTLSSQNVFLNIQTLAESTTYMINM